LHPVGLLFPRINDDARSNSHQAYKFHLSFPYFFSKKILLFVN